MAETISSEMGALMPAGASRASPRAGLRLFDRRASSSTISNSEAITAMAAASSKKPIGVIGMITPWNWPQNQICAVGLALAAGCTMVLKPRTRAA